MDHHFYSQSQNNSTISGTLDLSSFPLLRIDELHSHEFSTLVKSEDALTSMLSETDGNLMETETDEQKSLWVYMRKIVDLIRREIAFRRVKTLLNDENKDGNIGSYHDDSANNIISTHIQEGGSKSRSECIQKQINMAASNKTPSKLLQLTTSAPKSTNLEAKQSSNLKKPCIQEKKNLTTPSVTISVDLETKQSSPWKKPITQEQKKNSIKKQTTPVSKKKSKQRSRKQNISNTVVIPPNNSGNGSFRSRAKIAKAAVKARASITTDEHQNYLFEQKKRQRRLLAIQRMKERKIKRERRLEEKRRLKRLYKMKQKELRESKQMSVVQEMEQVALDAKSSVVARGETEARGNEVAAIAAALVLEDANMDDIESDSGSSLASEVEELRDQDEYFSNKDSEQEEEIDYGGQNSLSIAILEDDTIEDQVLDVDCHTSCSNDEDRISSKTDFVILDSQPPRKSIGDNEEKEYESFHYPDINEKIASHEYYLFETNAVSKHETPCHKQSGNGDSDIIWNPWSSNNDDHSESKSQETSCLKKYAFSEIFPTFYSIFTAFSSEVIKSYKKTDFITTQEKACLEYQIILQQNLTNIISFSKDSSNDLFPYTKINSCDYLFQVGSRRQEVNTIISDALNPLSEQDIKWIDISNEQGLGNCWNLLWTWKKPKFNPEHLLCCQKVSRFQNTSPLTRKDYLKKKLQAFCIAKHSKAIMPKTFVLPGEYNHFITAFNNIRKGKNESNSNVWIMKPIGMSRGRGITLINDIGNVSYATPSIIQKYISSPLLFHGYKFDLRLYVTVLSFTPLLEAFIYREGFARFSSKPFATERLDDIQMHLTNSSIQKDFTDDINISHPVKLAGQDGGGNKVKMSWLWKRLDELDIPSVTIWKQITELCLKTLEAVSNEISHQPNAFEVFGFDVMIDESYRPWLIEVNSCPSLARDTDVDSIVKQALIEDTIRLLSPSKIDRVALKDICERRLHKTKASTVNYIPLREQLEEDLRKIFCNSLPRQCGDLIDDNLHYERLTLSLQNVN